jgi:hypothetical protein
MKKLLISAFILLLGGTMSYCDRMDELFKNPNEYTPDPDVIASGLFTHLQTTRFFQKDYGEWYWMLAGWDNIPDLNQTGAYHFRVTSQKVTSNDGTVLKNQYNTDSLRWGIDSSNEIYWNRKAYMNYGDPIRGIGTDNNGNDRGRFEWFYTNMNNYALIQTEVANSSGANYNNSVIYGRLSTVLKDIVALQTVDLFNKIPYYDAFKGKDKIFFPAYDDPREIYHAVIENYAATVADLPAIYDNMSAAAKHAFSKQDIFFKGDVDKWVQYINAQILRSCVRISGVDAEYVKPFLTNAINNLPDKDFYFAPKELNQVRWGIGGNGVIYYRALAEASSGSHHIPDVIMLRMTRGSVKYEEGTDDPRLPVIAAGFTPTGSADNVEYYGVSGNYMRNVLVATDDPDRKGYSLAGEPVRKNIYPQDGQGRPDRAATRIINPSVVTPDEYVQGIAWSYYNPITYYLGEIPFALETRAEVDLFLAEVALKNLASTGKSASEHVQDAVLHSIDWWYMLNASGPDTYVTDRVPFGDLAKAILKPVKNVAAATQFAGIIKAEFDAADSEDGKMEIIMQQKYVHLNLNGTYELFAELRRTRHPKLEPISSFAQGALSGAAYLDKVTMTFERYRYPTSEQTHNGEEFAKVSADDNWTTPIFWANKASESYFLPKALKD